MDPAPLTTKEAATKLGVNRATIARWVTSGRMRPLKRLGAGWVFTTAEVDRIAALNTPTTSGKSMP